MKSKKIQLIQLNNNNIILLLQIALPLILIGLQQEDLKEYSIKK